MLAKLSELALGYACIQLCAPTVRNERQRVPFTWGTFAAFTVFSKVS